MHDGDQCISFFTSVLASTSLLENLERDSEIW